MLYISNDCFYIAIFFLSVLLDKKCFIIRLVLAHNWLRLTKPVFLNHRNEWLQPPTKGNNDEIGKDRVIQISLQVLGNNSCRKLPIHSVHCRQIKVCFNPWFATLRLELGCSRKYAVCWVFEFTFSEGGIFVVFEMCFDHV